jgi:hypothetical protein
MQQQGIIEPAFWRGVSCLHTACSAQLHVHSKRAACSSCQLPASCTVACCCLVAAARASYYRTHLLPARAICHMAYCPYLSDTQQQAVHGCVASRLCTATVKSRCCSC